MIFNYIHFLFMKKRRKGLSVCIRMSSAVPMCVGTSNETLYLFVRELCLFLVPSLRVKRILVVRQIIFFGDPILFLPHLARTTKKSFFSNFNDCKHRENYVHFSFRQHWGLDLGEKHSLKQKILEICRTKFVELIRSISTKYRYLLPRKKKNQSAHPLGSNNGVVGKKKRSFESDRKVIRYTHRDNKCAANILSPIQQIPCHNYVSMIQFVSNQFFSY